MRPRKLVQDEEVKRLIALFEAMGREIGPVEISATSVTIHPPENRIVNAYDRWKKAS